MFSSSCCCLSKNIVWTSQSSPSIINFGRLFQLAWPGRQLVYQETRLPSSSFNWITTCESKTNLSHSHTSKFSVNFFILPTTDHVWIEQVTARASHSIRLFVISLRGARFCFILIERPVETWHLRLWIALTSMMMMDVVASSRPSCSVCALF